MQKKGANISLKGYDDIFSTDQSRAEAQQERVQEIPLSELHPFEGHPFRVVDDEEMMKTAESVRDFGVLTPAIVRPDPDGGYEIVSGHRRHRASELAGKETMPAIVRDLDDDAAIILMVDANLQRETILPSERAFAYKMKLDAIKHQGERTDLTSAQLGQKSWAVNQVAEQSGDSRVQVQRYRGVELFNQRGCLILSDVEQMVFDEAKTTYATELWLLEDMSFAIVHCVKMKIGSEDTGYVTEYRAFKKPLEISEDLFFSPESLIEELESMCVPQWEHEATIYEL